MLQNPAPSPSRSRPPGSLFRCFQHLLTWGPQAGHGWGARAPEGEGRRGQGKPPAWRARGAPPPGRTQQAEAQEQGPATRAGLGARRGLGAAALGWTWVTCGRRGSGGQGKKGDEWTRPTPKPRPSKRRPHPRAQSPAPGDLRSLSHAPSGSNVPAPPSSAASAPWQAPPSDKPRPL